MYINPYEIEARQAEMMRVAEQERRANRAKREQSDALRRAIELLVGLLQPSAPAPRPEPVEPVVQPSKLATDSGIHRIR